jgi:hypothetical protein
MSTFDPELPVTTVRNRETKLVSAIFAALRGFLAMLPVRRAELPELGHRASEVPALSKRRHAASHFRRKPTPLPV